MSNQDEKSVEQLFQEQYISNTFNVNYKVPSVNTINDLKQTVIQAAKIAFLAASTNYDETRIVVPNWVLKQLYISSTKQQKMSKLNIIQMLCKTVLDHNDLDELIHEYTGGVEFPYIILSQTIYQENFKNK